MTPLLTDPSPAGGLVLCALLALAVAGGVALASDRPADPTVQDVVEVVQQAGPISSLIRDWNLPCAIVVDGETALEEL